MEILYLVSFGFGDKLIENNDLSVFAKMPVLKVQTIPTNLYTTEELAQIVAACPNVSGRALAPYVRFSRKGDEKDILICGKRKPFQHSLRDAERISAYEEKFYKLVERYKSHQIF
ncbi:MAG: hypothetical protein LBU61_03825 [Coriobacteriales bacterium]|nr:hypothetical protein [Coriobacteriales bacterium]